MSLDNASREALIQTAIQAKSSAYAPYSQFRVGAALLCADGTMIKGCNVENACYSATICAERTAIVKAVSEGQRDLVAIAVTTCVSPFASGFRVDNDDDDDNDDDNQLAVLDRDSDVPGPNPISPCGICRQVLREFCHLEMPVLLVPGDYPRADAADGGVREETVGGLLPHSFGPEELTRPRIPPSPNAEGGR